MFTNSLVHNHQIKRYLAPDIVLNEKRRGEGWSGSSLQSSSPGSSTEEGAISQTASPNLVAERSGYGTKK